MPELAELLTPFQDVEMFATCEQCGFCSSACPLTGKEGFNVRQIVRAIELDMPEIMAGGPYPWLCTTCGRCETVCPNGIAILDIIRPLRTTTPPEFTPEGPPPCVKACPGGIDIPGYVRLIAQGKPQEAYELILEKVPFPGILGRVCTHPCETECRRGEVNHSVSICALKRYAADQAGSPSGDFLKSAKDTGKKVAVIGSGPAGLTAAFYLRAKGHQVTVLESQDKAGGMMRYGIPAYRLPEEVLDKEINLLLSLGIELKTGQQLGRDFDLKSLKEQDFETIFLALGLPQSRKIDLEGADKDDVLWGVDFLGAVRRGEPMEMKPRVMVIGGGNVAVDVALTAKRVGAAEVTMACLESREEMPANSWEVEMALEEEVRLMTSWGPKRILGEDGKVTGIELIECTSVFDDEGRFAPSFGEATQNMEVDQVILAVGQTSDLICLDGTPDCRHEKGLILVNQKTQETNMAGVFAGGDVTSGPGTIIQAIASGKRAAAAMDKVLGGDGRVEFTSRVKPDTTGYDGKREKGYADLSRLLAPHLPLEERASGFSEVELCFAQEQAVAEAYRCLQCDLELQMLPQTNKQNTQEA